MSEDVFNTSKYEGNPMLNPPEVQDLILKYGRASIFSFAIYTPMEDADLFVLTKGLYVALRCNGEIVLGDDFEKNMVIIENQEDADVASLFGRVENTNLNVVLGGSFKKHHKFISELLSEGLQYMQVDCEFIGFFEVESNV